LDPFTRSLLLEEGFEKGPDVNGAPKIDQISRPTAGNHEDFRRLALLAWVRA
jgi:hypothetical protein